MSSKPKLQTVDDVAARLGFHRRTVYRLAQTGKIPSVRFGRSVRFDGAQVEEWIASGGAAEQQNEKIPA
jgi:excisionase family DNA binding protein